VRLRGGCESVVRSVSGFRCIFRFPVRFFGFRLRSRSVSDNFPESVNINPTLMILYYVLDTTFVPLGCEPVMLSNALPYAEAADFLASLQSAGDGGTYEMIEA